MAFTFGTPFLINTQPTFDQDNVSLAGLVNGLFVAVYRVEDTQLSRSDGGDRPADLQARTAASAAAKSASPAASAVRLSIRLWWALPMQHSTLDFSTSQPAPAGTRLLPTRIAISNSIVLRRGNIDFPGTSVNTHLRHDGPIGRRSVRRLYQFEQPRCHQRSQHPRKCLHPGSRRHQHEPFHLAQRLRGGANQSRRGGAGERPFRDRLAAGDQRRLPPQRGDHRARSELRGQPAPRGHHFGAHLGSDTNIAPGTRPTVAALQGGGFVVLWFNDGAGSSNRILGRTPSTAMEMSREISSRPTMPSAPAA